MFTRELFKFSRKLRSSVIDQDVDAMKFSHGVGNEIFTMRFAGKIPGKEQASPTLTFDELASLFSIVMLLKVRNRQIRTFFRESDRDGATNTGVTSSDQRHLVAQQPTALILRHVVTRTRIHRFGIARVLLYLRRSHGRGLPRLDCG